MRCSSGPVSTSGECALRPAETVSVSQDKAHELFVHHAQHGEVRGDPTQPNPTLRARAISADLDALPTRSRPDLAPLRFGQRARLLSAPRFGSGRTYSAAAATDRGRLGSFGWPKPNPALRARGPCERPTSLHGFTASWDPRDPWPGADPATDPSVATEQRGHRTRTPLLVPPGVASCVMYIYACLLCLSTYACMHAAFCFHVSCLNLASELANGLVVRWSIGAGGPPERLNRRNLGGAGERACGSALVSWRRPLGVPCAGAGGGLAMKCNAFGACVRVACVPG